MTRATGRLRALYCLSLLTWIFPGMVFGASSWIGLATGGGLLMFPQLVAVLVIFFLYRVYQVIRHADALDADLSSAGIRALRAVGIAGMLIGTLSALGMLVVPLVTLLVFGGVKTDSGIELFIVGLVLWALSNVSPLGWALFELSRVIATPRAMLPSARSVAGLAITAVLLTLAAYGLLELNERKERAACAPRQTLAACVAEPKRTIVRAVTAGPSSEVAFDSNVRSIEYRKAGLLRDGAVLYTESPSASLAAAGLKAAAGEARIRVRVRAEEERGGLRLRAEVFEDGERTAWLDHLAPARPQEPAADPGGKRSYRVVYLLEEPAVSLRAMTNRTDDTGKYGSYALDELFLFFRAAIELPLEAALRARTFEVAVPAALQSPLSVPAPVTSGEIDRQRDGGKESWDRCKEIITLYKDAPVYGGALPTEIARLRELHFKQVDAVPELYHPHDRLVCDSGRVFAAGYDRLESRVRIRRYDLQGNLQYSLRVKLPPLEAAEVGRSILSLHTLEEQDGELRFERRVWDTPKGQIQFVSAERFSVPIPSGR
jgi:hypothetical protein